MTDTLVKQCGNCLHFDASNCKSGDCTLYYPLLVKKLKTEVCGDFRYNDGALSHGGAVAQVAHDRPKPSTKEPIMHAQVTNDSGMWAMAIGLAVATVLLILAWGLTR